MHSRSFALLAAVLATPLIAEETRQLEAHEHGVGELNIAIDRGEIAMELHAPGVDIVGFEYAATSAQDRAAVDAAVAILARPLDLFVLSEAAACSVVAASAELESEEAHDDEGHSDEDHGHEDHADEGHAHKDHAHEEHAEDDHADEAGHTEFHAEYRLKCADPGALGAITFAYFDTFPNARELEVQVISDRGATAFEVMRDQPVLDLSTLF